MMATSVIVRGVMALVSALMLSSSPATAGDFNRLAFMGLPKARAIGTLCNAVSSTLSVSGVLPAFASLGATVVGISAVLHVSGALILTGANGYVAGTLGGLTATTLGFVSSTAVFAAGGVIAVVGVSMKMYCRDI